MDGDFAQQSQGVRLVSALLEIPGAREGLPGLLEQRQRLSEAPGQHIGISQVRGNPGEYELDVPGLTDAKAPFEHGDGMGEVSFAEVRQTDAKIRMTQGEGLINRRLGDLDRLFPAENALGKFSK